MDERKGDAGKGGGGGGGHVDAGLLRLKENWADGSNSTLDPDRFK